MLSLRYRQSEVTSGNPKALLAWTSQRMQFVKNAARLWHVVSYAITKCGQY
jgi:threonine/homoserine/homoserine lactone efflux protein